MKTIRIFLMTFLCFYAADSFAQVQKPKPLEVGDKMPELVFDKVIGFNKKTIKISDFKDKLLIFDFWATWCHACIEAFPKNDSLQKQFGDKIMIMLVNTKDTGDDEKKVAEFYKKRSTNDKDFKLPSIYMDTILTDLFPRITIPHYVLIRNGVIIAITGSEEMKSKNIEKLLNGEVVHFAKKD